jgi:RNA polymerase sigma factor for flagellar operon FliA
MTEATPGREAGARALDAPRHRSVDVDLWRRLRAEGDEKARHRLILHYAPLVKYVAGRLGSGLRRAVDGEDLISYGTLGLIDAVDRFEPERGLKFETYAAARIRGAIIDELRRLDWVPRRVRARSRQLREGVAELEHRLQRTCSEEELADHLGVGVADVRGTLADMAAGGLVALDELTAGGVPIAELLADPAAVDPEAAAERTELRRALVDTVRSLPDRERTIVALYYYESMTLQEVAGVLGVTESRVSQIHARVVISLRNRLLAATRA